MLAAPPDLRPPRGLPARLLGCLVCSAGVPGAFGPGRPRDRHTRAALGVVDLETRPCPPDPPAPFTPAGLRRPPIGRYLVCSAGVPGAFGPGRLISDRRGACPPARRPRREPSVRRVVSKPGQALQAPRRPPIGRYLVCMYLAWPCRHPWAPQPDPPAPSTPAGSRQPPIGRSLVPPGGPPRRCLSLGAPRAPGA